MKRMKPKSPGSFPYTKTEMTLARNPEADDIAVLFEQLTGRKPAAAEMLEVEQTLDVCGQGSTTCPWTLPAGFEDVTDAAIALGTIVCMVPAPQVAQPPNADTDRCDALPDSEKPSKRRRHRPRR